MNSHQPLKTDVIDQKRIERSNANFMSGVYFWMMLGLAITGVIAYEISTLPYVVAFFVNNKYVFIGLMLAQFIIVGGLSRFINKINAILAAIIYLFYTSLVGLTFSVIFLAFSINSISQAFLLTAFSFTGLSLFGFLTKRDLGAIGSFCITGLFGLVGFFILSWIFPSLLTDAVQMTTDVLGIVIFSGLTAWDTQKIKKFNVSDSTPETIKKGAIHGAIILYLDFINLFLFIFRLLDRKR